MFVVIATLLTGSRLGLGILFPWLPVTWRWEIVVYAAISDMCDGLLSRRFHATSDTGKVLDPIADKVFVLGVLGTLLFERRLEFFELILVGMRDFVVMTAGPVVGYRIGWRRVRTLSPPLLSKLATAGQFAFLFHRIYAGEPSPPIFVAAALASCFAGAQYMAIYLRLSREPESRSDGNDASTDHS